ncbi:MAG: hypothetical protein ACYCXW_06390 [Solirubrobacteraceae bacterium]
MRDRAKSVRDLWTHDVRIRRREIVTGRLPAVRLQAPCGRPNGVVKGTCIFAPEGVGRCRKLGVGLQVAV